MKRSKFGAMVRSCATSFSSTTSWTPWKPPPAIKATRASSISEAEKVEPFARSLRRSRFSSAASWTYGGRTNERSMSRSPFSPSNEQATSLAGRQGPRSKKGWKERSPGGKAEKHDLTPAAVSRHRGLVFSIVPPGSRPLGAQRRIRGCRRRPRRQSRRPDHVRRLSAGTARLETREPQSFRAGPEPVRDPPALSTGPARHRAPRFAQADRARIHGGPAHAEPAGGQFAHRLRAHLHRQNVLGARPGARRQHRSRAAAAPPRHHPHRRERGRSPVP